MNAPMRQPRIRVAFVSSHPIQYHAAWFRALANEPQLDFEVLFCHQPDAKDQGRDFGVSFAWDIPLLDGYRHRFLKNVATRPGLGSFRGLDTPEVAALIKAGNYDAVVVNGWHFKSALQAIRACWKADVPVLVRSDSHLHTPRHPLKKLVKELPYRWFVPRLDGCLPVGQWSSDYFTHFGARAERLFVVPHVVDPMFEREAERAVSQRGALRSTWGFGPDDVVFMFAGKFVPKKRPMDFVEALKRAHSTTPNVRGVMVGDGELRPACEQASRSADAPIHFTGFLNQTAIVGALAAADVLVLPSDGGETWGLIVNEAMTCGRPVIVSDHVGSGPDLVTDGDTGFVFPLGNVEAMAGRFIECASNSTLLAKMSARVRQRIRDYAVPVASARLTQAVTAVVHAA